MKKYWETGEKNDFGKECYRLHFSQFYEEDDENVVAGFVQDETDENIFIYVSKQPNGLYCRFSSITDCPTAWNMTREDYINMKMQEAKEDAENVLDNYLKQFDMVLDMYYPNNMTKEEFNEFLEETGYSKGE